MPVPCGVGQYSLLGESYCRACPRGHACAVVDAAPVPCLNGTFSLGNATSCVDAPKGFYSAITTEQPIRCPRGYTATSAKSRLCTRCPAGYECPSADVSVYWFIRLLVYWFIGLLVYFEGHLHTRVVHILALHLNTNTLHCVFHVSMFSTMTINLFRFHMFIRRLPLSGVSPEALQGTVPLPAPSVRRGTSQAFKLFIKVFILKVVLQLN